MPGLAPNASKQVVEKGHARGSVGVAKSRKLYLHGEHVVSESVLTSLRRKTVWTSRPAPTSKASVNAVCATIRSCPARDVFAAAFCGLIRSADERSPRIVCQEGRTPASSVTRAINPTANPATVPSIVIGADRGNIAGSI